ncbi:MAG: class I SAM-dependent methyltransferase [Sphingomonadales bacterium]|nr:class I SAM-dependent methyltransferase [Sphingomonadales bacterium]
MAAQPKGHAFLPLLGMALARHIRRGRLTVIDWRGRVARFGDPAGEPAVTIRLRRRWLPLRLALNPGLGAGEAWMSGDLVIVEGDLRGLLALITGQPRRLREPWAIRALVQARQAWRRLLGGNTRRLAGRNARHHYDIGNDLYRLFLDEAMHYSCAYFPHGGETLEAAQAAKVRHIAAKLVLEPGCRVLDIGSGWGGMAIALARLAGARVTGVTLAHEQLALARERAGEAGLADRVEFRLSDYREVAGTFDRIVSVGMLEHVGHAQYEAYFAKVAQLLDADGVALIHAIGRSDANGGPDAWTQRYIFPGGYIPSLSEVLPAIERSGLVATDIEILRLHYAETLRLWSERFAEHRAEARAMMGETFCRMWEFYLAGAEMSFRNGALMVFQIQLAHRKDAVPLTRDYIAEAESRLVRPARPNLRRAG